MSGENDAVDFLGMSDEELMALDPATLSAPASTESSPDTPLPDEGGEPGAGAETTEARGAAASAEGGEGAGTDEDVGGEGAESNSDPVASDDASDAGTDTPVKDEKPAEESKPDAIDYKAAYERLTAPFKANGRDITVDNIDDAIALMQMGANYNKKMAALKPNLKLLKMLENNGLLDEGKLSYLIDLDKKNPDAINKLVKDSGMDPLDLSAEKAGAYQPKTYTVDDREVELDTVLDELQSLPTYNRLLEVVGNKWDGASKKIVAETPQLLKVINSHIESGIYDTIVAEVERERMLGRLHGLSDIDAYRQVGDAIHKRGGFNHLGRQAETPAAAAVVVPPKPSKAEEDKLKDKRRAASTPKPAAAPAAPASSFNPLALSDEEFAKVGVTKFL